MAASSAAVRAPGSGLACGPQIKLPLQTFGPMTPDPPGSSGAADAAPPLAARAGEGSLRRDGQGLGTRWTAVLGCRWRAGHQYGYSVIRSAWQETPRQRIIRMHVF